MDELAGTLDYPPRGSTEATADNGRSAEAEPRSLEAQDDPNGLGRD